MSEQFEHKDPLSPESDEQGVAALISKMQKQLVSLERKIDLLINQSSGRPSVGARFSRPFRSFDRPHRPSDRRDDNAGGGERGFDRGRHFKKHYSEENRGFAYKKKDYGESRESNFGQDRNVARRNDGQNQGFEQKKKPFHYKQKVRS